MSRRAFGAAVGAAATVAVAPSATAAPRSLEESPFRSAPGRSSPRPNILFVLGDDLGWADLSCYGSPAIRTPNLDRLARQGVRFTHAYAGSSTCSPTRFRLYTGRYPGRTQGGLAEPITAPGTGLDPSQPTLASLLRDTGYATAMIGKWHCGSLPDFSPTRSGWDTFFGNFTGALEYYSKLNDNGVYDLYEGETRYEDLRYYTRILTERASGYVSRRRERPWLLNLNYTTPHWPWIADGDVRTGAEITARLAAGDLAALYHLDGGSLETYKAMVEDMDRSLGTVLKALERSGQAEHTLVCFASDNGGERWSYNWPLRGNKSSLLEGGIRVPTILRWPARIAGRQVSHEAVFSPDWTATLLEVGGAAADPAHPLDGRSLAGYLLRDERPPERDLFWRTRQEGALRRGNWKYYRGPGSTHSLYDVVDDPREMANKAADEPRRLAELRAAWERVNATLLPYPR